MENQGWLFSLSRIQYLQLTIGVLIFAIIWIFIGLLFKSKSSKRALIIITAWLLRLVLIFFSGWFLLLITGLSISDFFSKPVIVLLQEIRVSPIFLISLVTGIFLLIYLNKLLKKVSLSLTVRYGTERKVGRQVRRFLMVFLFLFIAGIWIKHAGNFISDFFGEALFELSNVKVTPGVLLYAILALYGIAVVLRIIEIIYTRHALSKGLDRGKTRTVFQIMKYFIWLISVLLILDSIGISINMLIAGSAALLVG